MSKKSSVQCYICGKWANSQTRDHIPPKCLAGGIPGVQFLTAPACQDCNHQFSAEESKFRDFLAMIGANLGIRAADGALEAFTRSVTRQNTGVPNRDLQRILNAINGQEVYSGPIYVGTAPAIRRPADLDVSKVLVKVARGLHYLHAQEVVPPFYRKDGNLLQYQHVPTEFHQAWYPVIGEVGDFFHYKGWWRPGIAVWVMLFYQRAYGIAWFHDPHYAFPSSSERGGSTVESERNDTFAASRSGASGESLHEGESHPLSGCSEGTSLSGAVK